MKLSGPYFHGGPRRNPELMIMAAAALTDDGGLPPDGTLIFTQLLLNLACRCGREKAIEMIGTFLDAADVRSESSQEIKQ